MIEEVLFLNENAFLPVKGTQHSACKDLFSPVDCVIPAHKNALIKTNIALAWNDPNYYVQILSRSGLAYKSNITVQAGVIDYDYRNNIGVLLQNNTDTDYHVLRGDRIAQYAYIHITHPHSNIVTEFSLELNSNRNMGGFGSTGK